MDEAEQSANEVIQVDGREREVVSGKADERVKEEPEHVQETDRAKETDETETAAQPEIHQAVNQTTSRHSIDESERDKELLEEIENRVDVGGVTAQSPVEPIEVGEAIDESPDDEKLDSEDLEPCPAGFERIEGQDEGETEDTTCHDMDECLDDNGGCSHQCVNTPGSAYCLCPDGWSLSADDAKLCLGNLNLHWRPCPAN